MEKETKKTTKKEKEDSTQIAYHGIRHMLYNKELVPGQRIAYRDLAERLELSPTPIIQALKWLELQGFVLHEPNRGYSMAPFSIKELEELYELRELIEPSLIPVTIEKIDKQGISDLKDALEAHLAADREFYLKERLFKNRDFHMTLASLSGKATQVRILKNVFDMLFLKYGGNYFPTASLLSTDQAHQEVFDAVALRSTERAQSILKNHLTNVKIQVMTSIKKILAEQERTEF
jgi:DNA-binding GntR family transcriptional regulator